MGVDMFILGFKKQNVVQREVKLLILLVEGDFRAGRGLFHNIPMDSLDGVVHAAAADQHFVFFQIIYGFYAYLHPAIPSSVNIIPNLTHDGKSYPASGAGNTADR